MRGTHAFICSLLLLAAGCACAGGCGGVFGDEGEDGDGPLVSDIAGKVLVDGSSTVHPIASAAVDGFCETYPRIDVNVGNRGTSGGFQRFTDGEIDIAAASLPIRYAEIEKCRKKKLQFIEVAIAYDGLTIAVNKKNQFVDVLTVEQLRKIFGEEKPAKKWSDVDPNWPAEEIQIFIPGASSGTLEYFKEIVVGKGNGLRTDVNASEEDNVLVNGISGAEYSIGFLGVAYYLENQDKLKAVKIVNPETKEAHAPSKESISSGDYSPFSRPLFFYVNRESLVRRHEVRIFVDYVLGEGRKHVSQVGYVELPESLYQLGRERLEKELSGTSFYTADGEKLIGGLGSLYKNENLVE